MEDLILMNGFGILSGWFSLSTQRSIVYTPCINFVQNEMHVRPYNIPIIKLKWW